MCRPFGAIPSSFTATCTATTRSGTRSAPCLCLIADLETSGAAEAEIRLPPSPRLWPGVDLLRSALESYGHHAGKTLYAGRIMAWHLRSFLGMERDRRLPR